MPNIPGVNADADGNPYEDWHIDENAPKYLADISEKDIQKELKRRAELKSWRDEQRRKSRAMDANGFVTCMACRKYIERISK
jgi:hypothetical protein